MSTNAFLDSDAKQILSNRQVPCSRIISVDSDSILFVVDGPNGECARTAWLHRRPTGALIVNVTDGFEANPPRNLHPKEAVPKPEGDPEPEAC